MIKTQLSVAKDDAQTFRANNTSGVLALSVWTTFVYEWDLIWVLSSSLILTVSSWIFEADLIVCPSMHSELA